MADKVEDKALKSHPLFSVFFLGSVGVAACMNVSFLSQPYRSSSQHTPFPIRAKKMTRRRLGKPAGTEIKTHQTELKCASYLHPFFFMMFPSTTSALQTGRGERHDYTEISLTMI